MLMIPTNDMRVIRLVIRDNEVLYARYIMKLVKRAMKRTEESISVFESPNQEIKGILTDKTFRSAISGCIDVFVRHEEFELAGNAQQIADLVEIHFLLEPSVPNL